MWQASPWAWRCRGSSSSPGSSIPSSWPPTASRGWLWPRFIIWFGIGELSKIVLASTLTFFLTFYGTFSGLRAVEPAYQEIARVMGASERQIFFKVSLPAASPWIVSALKVGVPFSLIGAIIGEFMAASRGLGYMIQLSTNQFDTTA
ncbi:MAG: hypothetical protein DMD90_27170, partial [Candidatus Rokuibacteriota bacterium]